MRNKTGKIICLGVIGVALTTFFLIEISGLRFAQSETANYLATMTVTRAIASIVFILVPIYLGYGIFGIKLKNALFVLPCAAVAINNLPIIALIRGEAEITEGSGMIALLIAECFFIALFEETAFRGVLTPAICRGAKDGKTLLWRVALSSAIFGLTHIFNLLDGAGIGATLMQVGYSFLIGGMCAALLLVCGSVIPCVIVHAIYDFCGAIVPTLGKGNVWSLPEIVLTAGVAVAVAVVTVWTLLRHGRDNFTRLYGAQEISEDK